MPNGDVVGSWLGSDPENLLRSPAKEAPEEFRCGAEHMICQALLLGSRAETSAGASVDSGASFNEELGSAQIASASLGMSQSESAETCGIEPDCTIDRRYYYEASIQRPPIPYTLLWLMYRLAGLPILMDLLTHCAGGMTLLEMVAVPCCPLIPRGGSIRAKLLGFFTAVKFFIVPQLLLPMVSTMSSSGSCETALITRAPDFAVLSTVYWVVIVHMLTSFFVVGTLCCCTGETSNIYVEDDEHNRIGLNHAGLSKPVWAGIGCVSMADTVVVMMVPVYIYTLANQFGLAFELAITATFSFDVSASVFVDLFQVMMFFLNLIDVTASLRKKMKIARKAIGNGEANQGGGVGPVGTVVDVLENNDGGALAV